MNKWESYISGFKVDASRLGCLEGVVNHVDLRLEGALLEVHYGVLGGGYAGSGCAEVEIC